MPISYLVFICAFPLAWILFATLKFKKNPKTGFVILCVYIALSKHYQIAKSEDVFFEPPSKTGTISEIVNSTQHNYEVWAIKKENKLYLQASPVFSKARHFYRLFILNSNIPEYIFNENGVLVDWTPDNHDDGTYQDRWEHPDAWKKISLAEANVLIKNKKIKI